MGNNKVSVIIPARNEIFLQETITDILEKARGDIEVITVLDGYWPDSPLTNDSRLKIIHRGKQMGMRASINSAASIAKGKYLLKCDAHCMFAEGFDTVLSADCEDNWIVVPRRFALDAENWCLIDNPKYPIDYMYLSKDLHGEAWTEKNKDPNLKGKLIDDLMSAQGSCWFMQKAYYERLELEDEENYGTFANEFQEVGLKCWLSGGRVVVNKKTWYAHLHKTKGRGYHLDNAEVVKAANYTKRWLTNSAWSKQTLPFEWLIKHFWPVPTWPEDWRGVREEQKTMTKGSSTEPTDQDLDTLAVKYGSDKSPQIHHFYTEFYEKAFANKRDSVKKILEIGVGYPETMKHSPNYQSGASLFMWQDYFPKAKIYGIDIKRNLVFKKDRIETYLCNQTDKKGLIDLINKIGSDIDVVIDDGSHVYEEQIFTCLTLMPLLKEDVIYIIEDVRYEEISNYLKGYNVEIITKAQMKGIDDRLVKVTNKI